MSSKYGWSYFLLGIAACGTVAKLPDAAVDAPEPDALVCTAQLACGGTCFDPMTSHDHCGTCTTACLAAEDCAMGHCADATTSCLAIKQLLGTTTNGVYEHKLDHKKFYCDFANNTQYDELGMAHFNAVPPGGWTMVGVAEFTAPATQQAFIGLFNAQNGEITNIVNPLTGVSNCCVKISATVGQNLLLNGVVVQPATPGAAGTTSCMSTYAVATVGFTINYMTPVVAVAPLAMDFFTTNVPTQGAACSDGANPAFYWRKQAI